MGEKMTFVNSKAREIDIPAFVLGFAISAILILVGMGVIAFVRTFV